jgi:phosphonate transport system permease protein
MRAEMKKKNSSFILAGILSTFIPGLGQFISGQRYRGVAVLLATLVTLGMVSWYGKPFWYAAPILIWLWNIWDAVRLSAQGRSLSIALPVIIGLGAALGIGWNVVGIDFSKADLNRAIAIMRPMLHPDFIQKRAETMEAWVEVLVPCLPGKTISGQNELDGKKVTITPYCADIGQTLTITATGLWPNTDTDIWWEDPSGSVKMVAEGEGSMLVVRTDSTGTLTASFKVPTTATIAIPDVTQSPPHRVYLQQSRLLGGIELSYVGSRVLLGGLQTVGMALIATALALILAIPISFLAARNLMGANPFTYAIYVIVRTFLNILRSIESLIIAIVFVVIVGLGPFAGVLALAAHSVAALAKLYSEVIEGIDPGPIEAVRATGANWAQVVRYAVIPQIVPPFTAFTIYRWDINVRSATIIGFVGGGGIGFLLIELIRINNFAGVSALFITIAVIVILLDYVSAKIRERLV